MEINLIESEVSQSVPTEGTKEPMIDIVFQNDINKPSQPGSGIFFTVMSYNVLADTYSKYFSKDVEPQYLDFNYRSTIVLQQLKSIFSDIICLQEIDKFEEYYKERLENLDYHILYEKRTNPDGPDGCVIGAKKDMFEVVSSEILKFDEGHDYQNHEKFRTGNVAAVAKLKHKPSGEMINIINVHFYWDPKFDEVKYLQMAEVIRYVNRKFDEKEVIIWTGDFNSKPISNAVEYILRKMPPSKDYIDFPEIINFDIVLEIFQNLEKLDKKIEWGSVYENYGASIKDETFKYPPFTNYTKNFKDTLDHLFYSKKSVNPRKLMKLPLKSVIYDNALPNKIYPSDHLPIMALFEILQK